MTITAELKPWFFNAHNNVYFGRIHNDIKNRWPDGTRIHTSKVIREDRSNPGIIIVHTLNSIYLLRVENRLEAGDDNPWDMLGP